MINGFLRKVKNFFMNWNEQSNVIYTENIQNHDRFVKSGNIVIDNKTGLMWQDDQSIDNAVSWCEAFEVASKCRIGNFNDWRIPSIDELKSILDKNTTANLHPIFEYNPMLLWTSHEDKDGNIYALFVGHYITVEFNIEPSHRQSMNYVRLVRNTYNTNNEISSYDTNIKTLTCTCKNWQLTRSDFQRNDPRRLCKHLIQKLDENNLTSDIFRYKENIVFYKSKNKGFRDDFNHLIEIPNSGCTLLYKYEFEWMSLFDEDGNKYGFMIGGNGHFSWSKETKPTTSSIIELFFTENEYLSPIELSDVEINEVIEVISDKYKVVQENNHIYSSIAVIYDIVDENGDYRDAGSVSATNQKIDIELYGFKNKITLFRNKNIIEEKLEERLVKIKSGNYWEIEYQKYKVDEEEYSSTINKFLTTSIMLNNHNSSIKTSQFNKVLEKMNFIKKVQNYNNSKWILIGDGLKYGINSQKRHVEYSAFEIPDWYVISKFDYHTKEYQIDESRYQTYATEISWNKEKFQDLLDLIGAYSEPKEKIVSERKIEREEWLQFVECPHCASKNIHKKNKRTYGYGEVQRYQCMDCKKIFQIQIESV